MIELKSCPFCGALMDISRYTYPSGHKVWRLSGFHTDDCMFEVDFYWPENSNKRELVMAWNRRANNG